MCELLKRLRKSKRVSQQITCRDCQFLVLSYYGKRVTMCGNPDNPWPKWKARPTGAVNYKHLSREFFPVPSVWCKRRDR